MIFRNEFAPSVPRRGPSGMRFAGLLVCGLATGGLAGCASDSNVVARIGPREITKSDFLEVAKVNAAQYPADPESAKAMLLEDIVRRELLVQGALGSEQQNDSLFLAFRRETERRALRERLYQSFVSGPIPVSEAEVEQFYRWRDTEGKVRVIFTLVRPQAEDALREIQGGMSFAAAADRFNIPGVVPAGGDLGFMAPGSLVAPLDDHLRTAPIGQVVGPLESKGQGFCLMVVEERRKREQEPLEAERTQLTEMLRQRKQRMVMLRYLERLTMVCELQVLPGAPQLLAGKLRADTLLSQIGDIPVAVPEAERGQVLAQFRGGAYTLGTAVEEFNDNPVGRPNLNMHSMVEKWIEGHALSHASVVEAMRRRLHEDPHLQRTLRERLNNRLMDVFYQKAVVQPVMVTSDEVRMLHRARADRFVRLDQARLVSVQVGDSSLAQQLVALRGQAPSLREAVSIVSPGTRVRDQKVAFPSPDPLWSSLESKLVAMAEGDYAGPYALGQVWLVFQLLSKTQGPQSFEQLPPMIIQQMQTEALEVKREARLAVVSDSLRRAIPVVTYPERLRGLVWPQPTPPTMAAAGNPS